MKRGQAPFDSNYSANKMLSILFGVLLSRLLFTKFRMLSEQIIDINSSISVGAFKLKYCRYFSQNHSGKGDKIMAEIIKWNASQVLPIIRHNMRHLEDGNNGGNNAIKPELTSKNYSLIDRGKTCKEINKYRKDIEKECFKYNRKNLVHAVEVVVQCPADCPPEQKQAFFQESFKHICEGLPMGEKCVFVAEVHADERVYAPNGTLISKDHLHVMYVPAMLDTKHDNFQYKLCADGLTQRATLREFHPALQRRLDEKGIHATVYSKKSDGGKTIGLSVKQLKEITKKTGVTIDHSITVDELANIMSKNVELSQTVEHQTAAVSQLQETVQHLQSQIVQKDVEIAHSKSVDFTAEKENSTLREKLHTVEQEKENLRATAQQIISDKNSQITALQENVDMKSQENQRLQEQLRTVQQELQKTQEKIHELESKPQTIEAEKEQGWGASSGWGNTDKNKTVEVEI